MYVHKNNEYVVCMTTGKKKEEVNCISGYHCEGWIGLTPSFRTRTYELVPKLSVHLGSHGLLVSRGGVSEGAPAEVNVMNRDLRRGSGGVEKRR